MKGTSYINPLSGTPVSSRHRRLGKKALQSDRLARVLDRASTGNVPWYRSKANRKYVLTSAIGLIMLIALGSSGVHLYSQQAAASEKIATEKRNAETRAKDIAADACRQKKVEEKSELIGKVTYDELYDGNDCDK